MFARSERKSEEHQKVMLEGAKPQGQFFCPEEILDSAHRQTSGIVWEGRVLFQKKPVAVGFKNLTVVAVCAVRLVQEHSQE